VRPIHSSQCRPNRRFFLLAPPQAQPVPFGRIETDAQRHHRLLSNAQRLRGRIYVRDGAVHPWQLSADGRHVQQADDLSWHLLTVDENESVTACIRYLPHAPGVSFRDLTVSRSHIVQSAHLGSSVREAVEAELDCARERGFSYVELGGWAISDELRCTTEALRTLLTVYALAQLQGGALGLTTATTRHHSSSILRRVGGRPLLAGGAELPSYYDSQYKCEMELLGFDSTSPNPRYVDWILECRTALQTVPVISYKPADALTSDLLRLSAVVRSDFHPRVRELAASQA
jgi:hypothetical protein